MGRGSEGEESEIKEWFKTINIAGIPLNDQELLNAIYSGEFVTLAKAEYSKSNNADIQKWSHYVKGTPLRQEYLSTALTWVANSKGWNKDKYMAEHRHNNSISELKTYFNSVIDWVSGVFNDVEKEMCGLEWGRLYETYHTQSYDTEKVSETVRKLYGDPYIKKRNGIFEYILGGETDTKLLEIRIFDEATKQSVYKKQTDEAKANGISNCPYCAMGDTANNTKIWGLKEMDADHVTAWSKGGTTDTRNCQMLCRVHNQAKGNK